MRLRKRLAMIDRERADWERWCEASEARLAVAADLNMTAWGVIANAHGGRWEDADPEWREAAERWRYAWHDTLRVPQLAPVAENPA